MEPVSGLPAWFLWRSYYLLQVPSLFRKARIAVDWTLDVVFPPDIGPVDVDVNTLEDPVVLEYYRRGWRTWNE